MLKNLAERIARQKPWFSMGETRHYRRTHKFLHSLKNPVFAERIARQKPRFSMRETRHRRWTQKFAEKPYVRYKTPRSQKASAGLGSA